MLLISGGINQALAQKPSSEAPPPNVKTESKAPPTERRPLSSKIQTTKWSIITSSCPPTPASAPASDSATAASGAIAARVSGESTANIAHVFSKTQLTEADKNFDEAVIVSHGVEPQEQLADAIVARYSEVVPVFVSKKRKLDNLSKEQVIQILKGEITNWSQVGERPGPIVLYLHGGVYQIQSFKKFLETIGLSPMNIKAPNIRYSEDYQDLEAIAGQDENAVVFGLRKLEPEGLKIIKIDNISILDVERLSAYPFNIPVILYKGKTIEANKSAEKFIKEIDKNNPLDKATAGATTDRAKP